MKFSSFTFHSSLLSEIWSTSKRNKLRTSLTGFAVAWGIFMLIFLLGAGNGLINAQLQQSDRFLANSMVVYGQNTSKAYNGLKEGRPIDLNDKDMLITDHVYAHQVGDVGGQLQQYSVNINYGDNYIAAQTLTGVYPSHTKINKIEMLKGRFINQIDMQQRRKVVVMSRSQAKELVKDYRLLVGKNVKLGDLSFKVVGIYKDDETRQNNEAFTSFYTVKTIYAKGDKAGDIEFTLKNMKSVEDNRAFEKNYRASINKNHQAAPDDERSLWLWNRYLDQYTDESGYRHHPVCPLDNRTLYPTERHRGREQHYAHHRKGTDPRVWCAQGHRSQTLVNIEAHHHREYHHHFVLWIYRYGVWRGSQ